MTVFIRMFSLPWEFFHWKYVLLERLYFDIFFAVNCQRKTFFKFLFKLCILANCTQNLKDELYCKCQGNQNKNQNNLTIIIYWLLFHFIYKLVFVLKSQSAHEEINQLSIWIWRSWNWNWENDLKFVTTVTTSGRVNMSSCVIFFLQKTTHFLAK